MCRNKHFNAVLLNLNERTRNIIDYIENIKRQSLQSKKCLLSRLPSVMELKKQLSTCNHSVIN